MRVGLRDYLHSAFVHYTDIPPNYQVTTCTVHSPLRSQMSSSSSGSRCDARNAQRGCQLLRRNTPRSIVIVSSDDCAFFVVLHFRALERLARTDQSTLTKLITSLSNVIVWPHKMAGFYRSTVRARFRKVSRSQSDMLLVFSCSEYCNYCVINREKS